MSRVRRTTGRPRPSPHGRASTDSWFDSGERLAERVAAGDISGEFEYRDEREPWRLVAAITLCLLGAALIVVVWRLGLG